MKQSRNVLVLFGLAVVIGLVAFGLLRNNDSGTLRRHPAAVMGTSCTLTVVTGDSRRVAHEALDRAEAALRDVESRMSVHLAGTELSRFNAAQADEHIDLSDETLSLMKSSRELCVATGGAFDVTCRPLIELWKQAGVEDRLPTGEDLAAARGESNWALITLDDTGAVKAEATAAVDLGGIAKGYALDKAAEAMKAAGVAGGLVEVGGDIRCFGGRDGRVWRVGIRNPFAPDGEIMLITLRVRDAGVCTSGNYFRFSRIQGRQYSHIIDPRDGPSMGRPAQTWPSVTVIAPNAMTADAWATALSVLGPEGLDLIPPESAIQAMIVAGTQEDHSLQMTEGFAAYIEAVEDEGPSHGR